MKIVLFAPSGVGHTYNWAVGLRRKGYDVCIVTLGEHYSEEYAKSFEIYQLPKYGFGKLSYLLTVRALQKIINKLDPDIVHVHYASSYGFIASFLKTKHLVLSVWGSDVYLFPNNFLKRKMLSKALKRADVICSTSHDMKKETLKYTNKTIEIVPFGVDTSVFKPNDLKGDTEFTFGIVKGLKDVYGFPKLFVAFSKIVKENPNTALMIVGDGVERARYENMVKKLGIKSSVQFVGYVPNGKVPEYLGRIDVLVMPSESESFGVAALEAQACGIPVVVNNVGGLPEIVIPNVTGIIIPNNSPEEIYNGMDYLMKNYKEYKANQQVAINFVEENYSWDACLEKMTKIYNSII